MSVTESGISILSKSSLSLNAPSPIPVTGLLLILSGITISLLSSSPFPVIVISVFSPVPFSMYSIFWIISILNLTFCPLYVNVISFVPNVLVSNPVTVTSFGFITLSSVVLSLYFIVICAPVKSIASSFCLYVDFTGNVFNVTCVILFSIIVTSNVLLCPP